jgi:hypothetical protein
MSRTALAALLASLALLATPNAAPAQPDAALDPAALAILRRMAEQIRNLPSFRIEVQVEYDAVQRDGQTIEFGSTRAIAVRRPDRIRAEATDRSGARRSLWYDGRQVAVLDEAQGVFAVAEKSGDLDVILRFSAEQLGIPIPLGDLLSTGLGKHLDESLVFAGVVGAETLDGVRCDHLALRNADRGIQLWVEQGVTPLPRRIAITWEQAPGRPQFRARVTKWEIAPKLPDALFAFAPPKGAERIKFHERPAAPAAATGGR